jgi:hypothetical protein
MRFGACSHEREVGVLLRGGQWPAGCGAELREHVAGCKRCSEMVLVRTAMQGLRAGDMAAARLEAPGVIWWRAQLRKRNAVLEQVARPLKAAQMFAVAVVVSFAAGFGVSELRHSSEWMARLESFSMSPVVATVSGWNLPLVFSGIAALVVLGAVAFYLATDWS